MKKLTLNDIKNHLESLNSKLFRFSKRYQWKGIKVPSDQN